VKMPNDEKEMESAKYMDRYEDLLGQERVPYLGYATTFEVSTIDMQARPGPSLCSGCWSPWNECLGRCVK
jgi:hypothetical protein